MNIYVSNIEEPYKDTIIGHLVNSGTADLLLHKVQCWCSCAVDEDKRALPMVIYCSDMIYNYYSCLDFPPTKNNTEGKDIHNEIFKNIPHYSKNFLVLIVFEMVCYVQG